MRYFSLAAICILIGGCATAASGPRFDQIAQKAPASGLVRVYVYRTKAFYLAQAPHVQSATISVDDRVIGYLANGGFLTADIPAGHHFIVAASGADYSAKSFDGPAGSGVYIRIHDKTRTAGLPVLAGGLVGVGIVALADAADPDRTSEGRIWGLDFVQGSEAIPQLQELMLSGPQIVVDERAMTPITMLMPPPQVPESRPSPSQAAVGAPSPSPSPAPANEADIPVGKITEIYKHCVASSEIVGADPVVECGQDAATYKPSRMVLDSYLRTHPQYQTEVRRSEPAPQRIQQQSPQQQQNDPCDLAFYSGLLAPSRNGDFAASLSNATRARLVCQGVPVPPEPPPSTTTYCRPNNVYAGVAFTCSSQ